MFILHESSVYMFCNVMNLGLLGNYIKTELELTLCVGYSYVHVDVVMTYICERNYLNVLTYVRII